jgi:hypothetical protein
MTPDEIESQLNSLPLDTVPPALRERVLSAVRSELTAGRVGDPTSSTPQTGRGGDPTYGRRGALVSAAMLLVAIFINLMTGALDRRMTAEFIDGSLLPQSAHALEHDVRSISQQESSWVPDYLQRFGSF